jgi:UDP-N-acetylmuramoyl-tripeptide--D-alanyl-D-alanine ligase
VRGCARLSEQEGGGETVKGFVADLMTSWLCLWARLVLRARRPTIISVTGTVGKTTTVAAIAAVLVHGGPRIGFERVRKSAPTLNNDTGLPLVVLGYDHRPSSRRAWLATLCAVPFRALALATVAPYPRCLILENAAAPHGSIRRLASLAPPQVAVVTAIGPAHLDRFGTVEGIAEEKGFLVRAVAPAGLVVLGQDSPLAAGLEALTRARVVKVPGRGEALSRSIARVVGRHLGLADEVVEDALRAPLRIPGRLAVLELGRLTVINDAWNANPLSMRLGLDTLAERARPGQRRVGVLGMMGELGRDSRRYHEEIGDYARERTDLLLGVGALAQHYRPHHWFPTSADCGRAIRGHIRADDLVFVKGSNAVSLYVVVRELRRLAAEGLVADALGA